MWMITVEALRLLWSWVGCCWLPCSLRHAGSHRASGYASSDGFSKLETTRARVGLGLSACGSLCVRSCRRRAATAGQERPESLNLFKSFTLPSAVRMPRLPALARATANACTCPLRAITAR